VITFANAVGFTRDASTGIGGAAMAGAFGATADCAEPACEPPVFENCDRPPNQKAPAAMPTTTDNASTNQTPFFMKHNSALR
jgi:hypothetical protein